MGCILYEMCACRVPFDAPDLKTLIHKITKEPPPEIPEPYSPAVGDLFKEMLSRDPANRPPAVEVLKRPMVQDVVKIMLGEVREDPASGKGAADKASEKPSAGAAAAAASTGCSASAGKYTKGQQVEFYSQTHGEWLPANVTDVGDAGRIMLNVKPGVMLSTAVQAARVRPRQNADEAAPA
jgi:serine/threonine protein kinase